MQVYFGSGSYSPSEKTERFLPTVAVKRALPVGTKLWLSVHSLELLSLVDNNASVICQDSRTQKKRKYKYKSSEGGPQGVAVSDAATNGQSEDVDSNYVVVWVDISRNFSSRYVLSIKCSSQTTGKKTERATLCPGLFSTRQKNVS